MPLLPKAEGRSAPELPFVQLCKRRKKPRKRIKKPLFFTFFAFFLHISIFCSIFAGLICVSVRICERKERKEKTE